jgi:ribosome biogenesis protein ENP2
MDLEQGTFMAPIQAHCNELNKVVLAPVHQMLAVGNINGEIECYDSRSRDCLQCVKIFDNETTDLRFTNDGLHLAIGSSKGEVKIFDIRNNKPFMEFDHVYETPITSLKFTHDYILSSDRKTVKITNTRVQIQIQIQK